jgi:hypothetical protein
VVLLSTRSPLYRSNGSQSVMTAIIPVNLVTTAGPIGSSHARIDFEFKYVQGKANGAADAISRKKTKLIQPPWESLRMDKTKAILPLLTIITIQYDAHMISQLKTEYLQDSEFVKHFQTLKAPYTLRDGCLYPDGRFCVPDGSLRGISQHDHQDAVTAGHRGATKTIKTQQNH